MVDSIMSVTKEREKKGEWSERISQQLNEMSTAAVSSGWHTDERVTPKCIFYVGTCSSVDENGTSRAHCPAVRDRLLPTKVCLRHWTNILISLSLETYTHAPFRHVRTKFTAIRIPEAPFEIFRPVRSAWIRVGCLSRLESRFNLFSSAFA